MTFGIGNPKRVEVVAKLERNGPGEKMVWPGKKKLGAS